MRNTLRKWYRRMLCLTLALCVGLSSCVVFAVSEETQNKIDQTEEEKVAAEEEKAAAEEEQSSLNSAKEEMEQYLEQLTSQANSLNEQVALLEEELEVKEAEVAAKEAEVAQAEAELEEQYADMKTRIQYMYENGQNTVISYMLALLTGGITDMLNQVEYAVSINEYDRDMLENYKASKTALEQQYAELQDEQEALELLKTETEEKKQQVATQQASTGSKISSYNSQLAELEEEITDIDELIEQKTALLNELIAQAEAEEEAARIAAAQSAASSMSGTVIVGDANISRETITLSDYEILLLAAMIYCEAGGESAEGQLAVGYVIMNRRRSSLYPSTLEGVLRQSKQFEPVSSGRFDLVLQAEQDDTITNIVTESCWNAARTVINGTSNVGDSLFFRTWSPVPSLITNLQNNNVPYWIIGAHVFYYYWTSYSTSSSSSDSGDSGNDDSESEESDGDTDEDTE
ncbi:MAG: cell wall hydrolase [Lachnospiraceae bacterium]|nr:cell wall hydrolase [Lachnospiraceae bacterium]